MVGAEVAGQVGTLLASSGLRPSRALGQHFVNDPNTVRRIARLAGVGPGDRVVEIGAGLGSLTAALAETGAEVVAVERDAHLVPVLTQVLADAPVTIVEADATRLDWGALLGPTGPWHLVANLPYNIATPLVLDVLDQVPQVVELLVMVQKEVAQRLVAGPGSRTFGLPSLKVAYWATAELVGEVPRTVFVPRPGVDSALVRICRREHPAVSCDAATLFDLARTAFVHRRKMLRSTLGGQIGVEVFLAAGIDPADRPERLGIADWGRLVDAAAAPSEVDR